MDGFEIGRLRLLLVVTLVALIAGCSVSLTDPSPDVLDYCPASAASEQGSDMVPVADRPVSDPYDAESECVRRLPET